MKKFRDLIETMSDAEKVREFQDKINKLKIQLETYKEPEIVKLKIDSLQRELSVFVEL